MLEVEEKQILVNQGFTALGVILKSEDMSLAHELVYGTFRFLDTLDGILGQLCRKPLMSLPLSVQWILRSGTYQLLHMRTPAYASLNESVSLTGKMGFKGLKPVVNAILRNVQRKFSGKKLTSVSLPGWYRAVLNKAYGEERVLEWSKAWGRPPVLSYWSLEDPENGNAGEPFGVLPHARSGKPDLSGRNYMQNESAQAMAELIIRSGSQRVLDYCAAPGGKSAYLAAFGSCEQLIATDISARRIHAMKENFVKMGLNVDTRALPLEGSLSTSFDLVLVDAPCSALGILARHPEIAFLRREGASEELLATQKKLLKEAWSFVKPGGYLFYVICTLAPLEQPIPPSDASMADESLRAWMPDGIPCEYLGNARFFIQPDHRFDGFSGFLIQKDCNIESP
jgi:16S rRNA (cytosine967-C5)-methyltransferase